MSNITNDRIIIIERENDERDLAVIFDTAAAASDALDDSALIDDLAAEDSLDVFIPDSDVEIVLSNYETILAD